MTLRKCLFWCHLATGVLAGVVILIMSVTGALLAYERQIVASPGGSACGVVAAPRLLRASRLVFRARD